MQLCCVVIVRLSRQLKDKSSRGFENFYDIVWVDRAAACGAVFSGVARDVVGAGKAEHVAAVGKNAPLAIFVVVIFEADLSRDGYDTGFTLGIETERNPGFSWEWF